MSARYLSERIQKGRAPEITQNALQPQEKMTKCLLVYLAAFQFCFIMSSCFARTEKGIFRSNSFSVVNKTKVHKVSPAERGYEAGAPDPCQAWCESEHALSPPCSVLC